MRLLSPIATFMILSTGIHVAMVISSNPSTVMLPAYNGSIISIKIEEAQKSPFESKEKVDIKKFKSSHVKKTQSLAKAESILENERLAKSIAQKKSNARVTSILIEEFKQYFSYPKIAIQRNWQGKVLLSLRVSSAGKIKDIQIKNSSGYAMLDQAAVESMNKVKMLPKISSWLENDIELKLPVIYKLTEI